MTTVHNSLFANRAVFHTCEETRAMLGRSRSGGKAAIGGGLLGPAAARGLREVLDGLQTSKGSSYDAWEDHTPRPTQLVEIQPMEMSPYAAPAHTSRMDTDQRS